MCRKHYEWNERDDYALQMAHLKAQAEDKAHRQEIHEDVAVRWPDTERRIQVEYERTFYLMAP